MKDQNYQELLQKLHLLVGDQVTDTTEQDILRELKANPSYFNLLSREKAFREFIKRKIPRHQPSPSLIQSIKERIRIAAEPIS